MLNKVILQGRLVADPEIRHTQNDISVASLRIACDRSFKSKDPNAQNADFINIVAWRSSADFIQKYFTKGQMILIEGRLQVRSYQDNSGQNKYVTEVVVDSVNFCGSKRESGSAQGGNYQQNNSYSQGRYGGYAKPAQNVGTSYGGYPLSDYGCQQNDFLELNDDDGELPF